MGIMLLHFGLMADEGRFSLHNERNFHACLPELSTQSSFAHLIATEAAASAG